MINIKQLKLPNISEAGRQALELVSDNLIEMSYLADYLGKDPIISAVILKYVNSPVHRRACEINSVRNAVSLLGLKTCKMIIGVTILQTYKSAPSEVTEKIWNHSISVATVARLLAEKIYPALSDEIETTALMHDMGMLVLASSFPDTYPGIINECIANQTPLSETELQIYGITHNTVIDYLAPILKLPSITTGTIHDFNSHEKLLKVISDKEKHLVICHLAHHVVQKYENYVGVDTAMNDHIAHDLESLAILLNLSDNQLKDLMEDSEIMLDIL
ncbi:MAG: HDOD domain-containing protein [Pseudomonadota bacterium]